MFQKTNAFSESLTIGMFIALPLTVAFLYLGPIRATSRPAYTAEFTQQVLTIKDSDPKKEENVVVESVPDSFNVFKLTLVVVTSDKENLSYICKKFSSLKSMLNKTDTSIDDVQLGCVYGVYVADGKMKAVPLNLVEPKQE